MATCLTFLDYPPTCQPSLECLGAPGDSDCDSECFLRRFSLFDPPSQPSKPLRLSISHGRLRCPDLRGLRSTGRAGALQPVQHLVLRPRVPAQGLADAQAPLHESGPRTARLRGRAEDEELGLRMGRRLGAAALERGEGGGVGCGSAKSVERAQARSHTVRPVGCLRNSLGLFLSATRGEESCRTLMAAMWLGASRAREARLQSAACHPQHLTHDARLAGHTSTAGARGGETTAAFGFPPRAFVAGRVMSHHRCQRRILLGGEEPTGGVLESQSTAPMHHQESSDF